MPSLLVRSQNMRRFSLESVVRILVSTTVISFLVAMSSCVGCYSSSESSYPQYDGGYGNPVEKKIFASIMGLSILIFCISSVALLSISIAKQSRTLPQPVDIGRQRRLFKGLLWTTIVCSLVSMSGCVGFIATRPSPDDFSGAGRDSFAPFAMTAFLGFIAYGIAAVLTGKNYCSTHFSTRAGKS